MNIKKRREMLKSAHKLLVQNRKKAGRHLFTIPSPQEYRHQWLWDSCFHAIVLRHFEPDTAKKELLSLMASQRRTGMVPHESKYSVLGMVLPFTSRVTQPPFIARATLEVYGKSRDADLLARIFPKLQKYHAWLEKERETGNILTVADSNESGEDDSVTWDDEFAIPIHRTYLRWISTYLPLFPKLTSLKSLKATAIYADSLECMSQLARLTGRKKAGEKYADKRNKVITAMRRCFRQKDGLYYSRTSRDCPIKYKTNSIFAPMFAGAITKAEAKKLVQEHLLNKKEFWTKYAIPTVAISERKFEPEGYWRGPMWININWMVHRGLLKYGFDNVAERLLAKTISAIRTSGYREYYNPLTGEGLGAKKFSWSTLVVDMILQQDIRRG